MVAAMGKRRNITSCYGRDRTARPKTWKSHVLMLIHLNYLYIVELPLVSFIHTWLTVWTYGRLHIELPRLHLLRQKSNCASDIFTPFVDVLFGVIHSRTLLENLLSVIVTHSSVLLMSPVTPAWIWHLRWTQLTISLWCYSNLPTAWWAE